MNEYDVYVTWEMRDGERRTFTTLITAKTPEAACNIAKKFVRASASKSRGRFVSVVALDKSDIPF